MAEGVGGWDCLESLDHRATEQLRWRASQPVIRHRMPAAPGGFQTRFLCWTDRRSGGTIRAQRN